MADDEVVSAHGLIVSSWVVQWRVTRELSTAERAYPSEVVAHGGGGDGGGGGGDEDETAGAFVVESLSDVLVTSGECPTRTFAGRTSMGGRREEWRSSGSRAPPPRGVHAVVSCHERRRAPRPERKGKMAGGGAGGGCASGASPPSCL